MPLGLRGIASTNRTATGCLKRANLPSQCFRTASSVSSGSFFTTTANGDSPHFWDGMPMTAVSVMPGRPMITFSISAGYTFSPPEMIMSLMRSWM